MGESGGKGMFTGEYHHNLDTKGRMIIPVKFREELSGEFFVTRSFDGCLSMYAPAEWKVLEDKLTSLPMANDKARKLRRFLLGGAASCEMDKQGRILLPQNLRKEAKLEKDVILVGVGDHVEIWPSEKWESDNDFTDYEGLAEDMEGLGI